MTVPGTQDAFNLLQQRAEIAGKLRKSLSDPFLRSSLRDQAVSGLRGLSSQRASATATPGHAMNDTPIADGGSLPSESCFLHTTDSMVQKAGRAPDCNRRGLCRGGIKRRSLSTGFVQCLATTRPKIPVEARIPQAKQPNLAAVVNTKPIVLRGKKQTDTPVSCDGVASHDDAGSRCASGPGSRAETATCDVELAELHVSLQAARDRLEQIENERRQLIDSSINLLARSSSRAPSGIQTPVSPAASQVGAVSGTSWICHNADHGLALEPLAPNALSQRPFGRATSPLRSRSPLPHAELPGSELLEKPAWLLDDGRLLTACLEGENRALRKAVTRAQEEIDELVKRRSATEDRARFLAEENQAAALALRRIASTAGAGPPKTTVSAKGVGSSPVPMPTLATNALPVSSSVASNPSAQTQGGTSEMPIGVQHDDAARCLRELVLVNGADSVGGSAGVASMMSTRATPRRQLLERSEDIGRRMEEILLRRGRLQEVFDSTSDTIDASSCSRPGGSTTSSAIGADFHTATAVAR